MVLWMLFVAAIVVVAGFWPIYFTLSDTVLTTLVAGATVNVIGLFASVLLHLFPRGNTDGLDPFP